MSEVTRFRFPTQIQDQAERIEADMAVAILCAESIYGKPRVRMEATYAVDPNGEACVVKSVGEAGAAVTRMFAGLASLRLGEQGYSMERLADSVKSDVQ